MRFNFYLIKRLVGSCHIKSFIVLHQLRAMMYLQLMIVLLWAYTGNSFRRVGNYRTHKCSRGRFTLHCSASQMKWIRCANGKCAIIYQRDDGGEIVVHNANVLDNGTISDVCANRHGWIYICQEPSKQSSWGIDNIGMANRKY